MPFEDTKILKLNQNQKSDETPVIIFADLECLIEKTDRYKNKLKNVCSTKVGELIPSGFPTSTISPFKITEKTHDVYRGKDCMKKFCKSLKEHAMKIANFKIKNLKLLIKEQQGSYENAKICYIYNEKFENKYLKDKKYLKIGI